MSAVAVILSSSQCIQAIAGQEQETVNLIKISKFDNIGKSRLVKQPTPNGIPRSLFQRELGFTCFPETDGLEKHLYRQLMLSRAPGEKEHIKPRLETFSVKRTQQYTNAQILHEKKSKWIKSKLTEKNLPLRSSVTCKQNRTSHFIDETIMIKEKSGDNSVTRNFFVPSISSIGEAFKLKYAIKDDVDSKWESFDTWYITELSTELDKYGRNVVPKQSATLFVVLSRKLILYNLNTGLIKDELVLSAPDSAVKYAHLQLDQENNRVYVTASKTSLASNLTDEVLVLSYPPLTLLYKLQTPKGSLGKGVTSIENVGSLFCITRSSKVEIADIDDVLSANTTEADRTLPNGKTITVKESPPILFSLKTKNGHFIFDESISPALVYARSKNGFEIYNIKNSEKPAASIVLDEVDDFLNRLDREPVLSRYNEDAPQILLHGLSHGFEIMEIKTKGESTVLKQVLSTKSLTQNNLNDSTNSNDSGNRNELRSSLGLRKQARKCYFDEEKSKEYAFDYSSNLNLFAVCSVSDHLGILEMNIFDNRSYKLFKKLQPVMLNSENKKNQASASTDVQVHFESSYIAVKLKRYTHGFTSHSYELYFVNLLTEDVDIKL